ncbi:MAG: SCO family protein [Ignavibacteria bacterium]|nr:SCO family protein [Ignavibacteria bacterium]MCC7158932.1 SCO family protein [Ignavibacteria bacterium]
MNNIYKILAVLLFVSSLGLNVRSEDTSKFDVGIDEKLGETIPLDLSFLDEYGKPVTLRSLFTKPTLLTLVYYKCPGICSPLLNGVSDVVDKMDMEAGRDFNIVTISFSPKEDYIMAAGKKKNYTELMKKKIPDASWSFLTGDSASIAKITNAVGFRYQKQGEDYMHGAVVTVLSPEGKISRYLYGTDYLPLDVKLALTEAAEGKSVPAINKLLKLCYSYDPDGRKYVLNFTRIVGGIMIVLIAGFVLVLTMKKKKNNNNIPVNSDYLNGKGNIKNG